jgi:aminoglycoside 2'-N-acetyltransferase I
MTREEITVVRKLLWDTFGQEAGDEGFTEFDWQHALGGMHFLLDVDGEVAVHAAVVERELQIDRRPIRTGYVEAVGTRPDRQYQGLGTIVMRDVGAWIDDQFELGALGTGSHGFYQRLGWVTWRGPTSVRTADGTAPTPDEDGYILVLPTRHSPPLDFDAPISCDWRPGDVW